MTSKTRRRVVGTLGVLTGVLLLALGGMYVAARRTHDPDDPRTRPNSYVMTHTVTMARQPHEVFDFITYRMKDHNLALATAHESFAFRQGQALTPGAVFVTEEFIGDDGVRNEYVVREVVPNRLIHMASTPSQILRRRGDSVEDVATCNAYVYFDLDEAPGGTRLTQTVVIEMSNFVMKFLTDLAAARAQEDPWQLHLVEELEALKAAIERAPSD